MLSLKIPPDLPFPKGGTPLFDKEGLGAAKEHGVGKIVSIFSEDLDRAGHFPASRKRPLVRVEEDGVEFISYLDGSVHRFTPENVIHMQRKLGSDILFILDECTSPLHDRTYTRSAIRERRFENLAESWGLCRTSSP
jgi:tRNA-guanine family transglycosylase